MTLPVVVLALIAVVGFSFWTYFRRETPVLGRTFLAVLRSAALVVLVLLFWNPEVGLLGNGSPADVPTVLLDASSSMAATGASGESSWEEGVRRARDLAGGGGRVLLFGSFPRSVPVSALDTLRPLDPGSGLTPALERISALGGTEVTVISDFRLEDPVRIGVSLRDSGLGVRSVDVGGAGGGVGIAGVDGPGILPAGETGELEVRVGGGAEGIGTGPDSADLELRLGEQLLASIRIGVPTTGRTTRHLLPFTAPSAEGTHRLEVSVRAEDDAFPSDDAYPHLLDVAAERTGLVLLSLRPDWEPRYLLPVLEQVTGLEGSGFLRLSDGRWVPMGLQEEEEGRLWDDPGVQERASGARIVVLQGIDDGSPPWVEETASTASGLLLLPGGDAGYEALGLEVDLPRAGEWYVSPGIPASPLAGELAGIDVEGLPPLTELRSLSTRLPPGMEPLQARQGSQGIQEPVVALVEDEGRRATAVLASGFWRWAARDGAPREAYRRFWSAVSGWLLEGGEAPSAPAVAPLARPAPRGELVEWAARGPIGDSVSIRVTAADSVVMDTTVARSGSTVRTRPLPPGSYRYRATSPEMAGEGVSGLLEVTGYSDDFLRPKIDPPGAEEGDATGPASGSGRPLRTHPAPYVAVLLLLSAEWIGRRRQGLR